MHPSCWCALKRKKDFLTFSEGPVFARSPPIVAASQTSPCKCPLSGASGCLPVLEQGPWIPRSVYCCEMNLCSLFKKDSRRVTIWFKEGNNMVQGG